MQLMKTITLFFMALLMSATAAAEPGLDNASVKKMMDEIQASVRAKDATALASHFTGDATITMVMPEGMGGTITIGKADYIKMVGQAWALPVKHHYDVSDVQIEIAADKQSAIVKDITREKVEMDGKIVGESTAHETMTLTVVDGKPRIAKLHATMEM